MKYRELNLHQHCLHRPDTYIGSIRSEEREEFVWNDETHTIECRQIRFIPAIERLFVEALSNAIDNKWRSDEQGIDSSKIYIDIDEKTGETSITNDGMWIPVEKNENGVWIPQMIFGQLLTSSNYNDEEERYTSGRNGIGIKAVNIFSKYFSIECTDPERGLLYKQEWEQNMYTVGKPSKTKTKKKYGQTKVKWIPDFAYFGVEGYSRDVLDLIYRHVYDTAMILPSVSIYLNQKKIQIHSLKDYLKFIQPDNTRERLSFQQDRMEWGVVPSVYGQFSFVSFVNGIYTRSGGVHVNQCLDALLKPLVSLVQKKLKTKKITARDIKNHLCIVVNCFLPNPEFSNQTKNRLIAPKPSIQSISEKEVAGMLKWGFMEQLISLLDQKEMVQLQKTETTRRSFVSIPGYDRANKSGGKHSTDCSLILCEGLSAKTYAVRGIEQGVDFGEPIGFKKGRDWFGILSLRGKCFQKGTMVSMGDRTTKPIELVKQGDLVLSPSGRKRVLETISGYDKLYKVQVEGYTPYVVTGDHILVLSLHYRNSIRWNEEKCRWELKYYDVIRWQERLYTLDCSRRLDKDQGYIAIKKWMENNATFRYVHIAVETFMSLSHKQSRFLRGVVIPKFNTQKAIYREIVEITPVGEGEFYGFRIQPGVDGLHHFMLGDGTLVHNCLNVRNATKDTIAKNKEITNIIQALGLKYGVDYTKEEHYKTLSYGRIILLADSDVDGLHIQGLVLNLFHYLFPSLMKRQGFFLNMKTPLIKVITKKETQRFYDFASASDWMERNQNKILEIKYYKGLGTSNDKDIKETFGTQMIEYVGFDESKELMNLIFHKQYSNHRKDWIGAYDPEKLYEPERRHLSGVIYSMKLGDFLNQEMIHFSIDDCQRNLPCLYDGLKESQRKILYACFQKNMTKHTSIKVAQLAGFVAEKTNYHHGEQCLFDTIIKMAQDFVGSNNIPFLLKDGQVGSRISNGKDAASARYVFVRMNAITNTLFPKQDTVNLSQREEEGKKIEPHFYLPILPMLLVNGSEGIGTGWSCSIPSYQPSVLREWILGWLNRSNHLPALVPWYNGFQGEIVRNGENRFLTSGVLERTKANRVWVHELPIGMSIDKFKQNCDQMVEQKRIKSYNNYSTPETVSFELIEMPNVKCDLEFLGLTSTINTSNLVVLSDKGMIVKFDTVEQMLDAYCKKRYLAYEKRIQSELERVKEQHLYASASVKFLKDIMKGKMDVFHTPEETLVAQLEKKKYPRRNGSYSYLLDMSIKSFTKQQVETYHNRLEKLEQEISFWEETTPAKLWTMELQNLDI